MDGIGRYIRNSLKPRTSTRPVPFRIHSLSERSLFEDSPSSSLTITQPLPCRLGCLPPGIIILPAVGRDLGRPSALR